MSAFPIHRNIPSVPVSNETAHKLIDDYLEKMESSPYLRPNARLERAGPAPGPSGFTAKMYNMRRLEAGLRGEWLAPTVELKEDYVSLSKRRSSVDKAAENAEAEGWQDLDEYQREQEVVEGEIGPNDTEVEVAAKPSVVDKEARKKEKKLRMKEERRRKAQSKEHAQSEE